jgi:hypothetical protein
MNAPAAYRIHNQPAADSASHVRADAVITWELVDGHPTVASRYREPVWVWPAIGSLSSYAPRARCIDFELAPVHWRPRLKQILFACLRHPRTAGRTPSFHHLKKRFGHLRHLVAFADKLGISRLSDLTKTHLECFLRTLTSEADHIETVVGYLGTIADVYRLLQKKLLEDGIAFNVAAVRSSSRIAKALWKEVHGKDFDYEAEGYQPYKDEETEQILAVSFYYVHELAEPLLAAHREITRIWDEHRYDSKKATRELQKKVTGKVRQMLTNKFSQHSMEAAKWPPETTTELSAQVRLLQGACIAVIAFFTLARRSELLSLKADECLTRDDEGEFVLHGYLFKGEDDLHGRPASWWYRRS